ncbi:thioesterase family protein [Arthrobacter dokdonensis]|uniref:thioesterase family protein n=1 Tax=Arthrobacter dokdonellae TaxID=2211210 RepID=UPI000DE5AFBB|nr:thioesterase family protein [Arthrobacter dokdonellae]
MQETTTAIQAEAYYRHLGGDLYESTRHAQGAWNDHEQHMAPVTGLMVRALERFQPREGMRLTRFNFDIFGLIPAGAFSIETTVLRPGRTIELLQAALIAGGRIAVRVTAWRMLTVDTGAVAAVEDEPFPSLEESETWHGLNVWPGGFIASLEGRTVDGHRPGRGRAWLRTPHGMVDGEPTSALVRLLGLVDSANGIAARVPPGAGSYMFPNVDLSVHVYREPEGEWLGLDTKVTFAGDGIGLTSSVLHDVKGSFGHSEQILTVRPIPHAR